MDYFLDSGVLLVSEGLIAGTVCAALARHRGYSATVFGGLGCVAGLGAVPLTWLATARPVLGQQSEGLGFNPIHARSEVALPETSDNQQGREDLQVWGDLYAAVQQGLVVTMVLFLCGLAALLMFFLTTVVPTFVTLFEGTSLRIPPSTQFLILSVRFVRQPSGQLVLWLLSLFFPSALYLAGVRAGYAFPIVGQVWRCTDRLWQLYALQCYGHEWARYVPISVARRLSTEPSQALPSNDEQYEPYLRRQRDRLSTCLWKRIPLVFGLIGVMALGSGALVASVYLPLYQGLVGNLL